jgi:hypothetical protein
LQKAKELKEIFIQGHKKTQLEEMHDKYTSGMFSGGEGYDFDLVHSVTPVAAFVDILSFLQGQVPGLMVTGAYPNASVTYRGGTPSFFIDEMEVDVNSMENIPVSEIAYVKVFRPPFMGAIGGGPHGAIAIYTRRGGDEVYDVPGLNRLTLMGYSPIRTFYSPVYGPQDTAAGAVPDYRVTLLWSPLLYSTPQSRTVPVRFYNNDACSRFRIVVEGMDEDGRLLHLEQVVSKTR